MFKRLKITGKTVLIFLISLIVIVNVCVVIVSNAVKYFNQSAEEIVGKQSVDKVSFCVEKDYFKDEPAFILDNVNVAAEKKFSLFLIDVYKTKDNKAVCVPSENTEEFLGIDGKIGDYTYFDLLNYTYIHKNKQTSDAVMLCDDFVLRCVEMSIVPVIFPHGFESIEPIEDILKKYEYSDLIAVMSDNISIVSEMTEKYPSVRLWYKVNEATDEIVDSLNVFTKAQIIFNAENKKNNAETVEKIKAKNVKVGCYNVNSRSLLKKYVSLGVDDVVTSKYVKTK